MRNQDCIKITNLKVFAYHGVFEEEKRDGQDFYIIFTQIFQRRQGLFYSAKGARHSITQRYILHIRHGT